MTPAEEVEYLRCELRARDIMIANLCERIPLAPSAPPVLNRKGCAMGPAGTIEGPEGPVRLTDRDGIVRLVALYRADASDARHEAERLTAALMIHAPAALLAIYPNAITAPSHGEAAAAGATS